MEESNKTLIEYQIKLQKKCECQINKQYNLGALYGDRLKIVVAFSDDVVLAPG